MYRSAGLRMHRSFGKFRFSDSTTADLCYALASITAAAFVSITLNGAFLVSCQAPTGTA
jgi:hypothetical protein